MEKFRLSIKVGVDAPADNEGLLVTPVQAAKVIVRTIEDMISPVQITVAKVEVPLPPMNKERELYRVRYPRSDKPERYMNTVIKSGRNKVHELVKSLVSDGVQFEDIEITYTAEEKLDITEFLSDNEV